MTITVSPLFERGKTYKMKVLFVALDNSYINVINDSGQAFKVEVTGSLAKSLKNLRDCDADLVCTDVTDKGPEFALAGKYFTPVAKTKKGANIGLKEGLTFEFKKSLIYSAVTGQPDSDQPFEIAKQIAAFMNASGGDLYMGVDDNGFVTGIENDFEVLSAAPILMNAKTDESWTYTPNIDGYKRKLTNAVLFYLGEAAPLLIDAMQDIVDETSGLTYLKVHVNPSDDVIYLGREEQVVYRSEASVTYLHGRQREQYVKQRFFLRGEKSAKEAVEEFKKRNAELEKELKEKNAELEKSLDKGEIAKGVSVISVVGKAFDVAKASAMPLEKKFLDAVDKPAGIVYKIDDPVKKRFRPTKATTWMALYEQFLWICSEVDPEKFEALPDNKDFEPQRKGAKTKPNFVRRNDGVRLKSASGYIGLKNDIRANLAGISRASFLDPKKLPLRLMEYFGIDPADIRVWTGN